MLAHMLGEEEEPKDNGALEQRSLLFLSSLLSSRCPVATAGRSFWRVCFGGRIHVLHRYSNRSRMVASPSPLLCFRVLGRSGSSQTSKKWYTKRPYTPLTHTVGIGGQIGSPAGPGTGPFRHEIIYGSCRAYSWASLLAQARPESDLIVPGRPVWPDNLAARKCFNRV